MRAVAYCRYSTDNQTENSIMYQINAAQEFCERNSMELVDVYADEGQTGTNTSREALQRLLNDCSTDKFNAVVIYDQSRLSRNVVDWFSLRETLNNKGIKLFSCAQALSDDVLDSTSFLSEGVQAIVNQAFVLETRKKTIAGVTSKAKRAEFCGGTAPLGYDIVDGNYVINEHEANAIRLIFDMYVDGYSYKQIMEVLDTQGYKSKWGRKIGTNAIYYLLINERYAGVYTWNKYQYKQMRKRISRRDNPNYVRIDNAIPAIITKETWRKAAERMEKRKNGANKSKRDYLLSGLIECGYCGGTFTAFTSKNKRTGAETVYYMCGTKGRLKTCHAKNLRGDEIEPCVYYTLKDNLLNNNLIEKMADNIIGIAGNCSESNPTALKSEIAKKERAIRSLFNAISDIDKERASYHLTLDRIDELEAEIKLLKAHLHEAPNSEPIDRKKLIEKLRKDAEGLCGSFAERKKVIREYVNKIIITDEAVEIQLLGDYDITGGTTQI